MSRRADVAEATAFARWREQCASLPADVLRLVERTWRRAASLRGQRGRPELVALAELARFLILAGVEVPGLDRYWQDPLLVVWRAVRAAELLSGPAKPTKRRRKPDGKRRR